MKPTKVKIDLKQTNKDLTKLSAQERIKWTVSKTPGKAVATTSGGRTSRILPHLIKRALGKSIPTIFVDTGLYPKQTYQFLNQMEKEGIDIKYYNPRMSVKRLKSLYGNLWEEKEDKFDQFLKIVKHEPLNRAFKQLSASLWMRGIMSFQTQERKSTPIFELKNGLFRLHPVIDWSRDKAGQYLKDNKLPINQNHYDITKGPSGKRECKIGERGGFSGGEGI